MYSFDYYFNTMSHIQKYTLEFLKYNCIQEQSLTWLYVIVPPIMILTDILFTNIKSNIALNYKDTHY